MTREDFLNGEVFTVGVRSYKGDWTYRLEGGSIVKESRSSIDERVLTYNHECNVTKIGKVGFKGFTYVFNKKVNVNIRFEELFRFREEA